MLNPDDRLARLQSVKQRHECHANSVVRKARRLKSGHTERVEERGIKTIRCLPGSGCMIRSLVMPSDQISSLQRFRQ
jgi:hypothetical protein